MKISLDTIVLNAMLMIAKMKLFYKMEDVAKKDSILVSQITLARIYKLTVQRWIQFWIFVKNALLTITKFIV